VMLIKESPDVWQLLEW